MNLATSNAPLAEEVESIVTLRTPLHLEKNRF